MRLLRGFVCLGITILSLSTGAKGRRAPALFQVLQDAGASQFAEELRGDPYLLDMITAGEVRTVFAPADSEIISRLRVRNPVRRDANLTAQQDLAYQVSEDIEEIKNSTKPTVRVVVTARHAANLDGSLQRIVLNVTDQGNVNATSSNPLSRRGLSIGGILGYGDPGSFAEISTGLGRVVNVIQPDLEFARCGGSGVVHLVDSYFTPPQNLSTTARELDLTTFNNLVDCSGLTNELDTRSTITVFIPSNEAFDDAGVSFDDHDSDYTRMTAQQVRGLVVPGFVGYTPYLYNGQTLPTLNGSHLIVEIKGHDFVVGGARIVKPNVILSNGVAHIVDKAISWC